METKDSLELHDLFSKIVNSYTSGSAISAAAVDAARELQNQIDKELLKVSNLKQIHFSNPTKINGKYESNGFSFEIVYLGRDLGLDEDNFTWLCRQKDNPSNEAQLTVFKNPIKNGEVKLHMKSIYETKPPATIRREFLNEPTWIRTKLLELANPNLPF